MMNSCTVANTYSAIRKRLARSRALPPGQHCRDRLSPVHDQANEFHSRVNMEPSSALQCFAEPTGMSIYTRAIAYFAPDRLWIAALVGLIGISVGVGLLEAW